MEAEEERRNNVEICNKLNFWQELKTDSEEDKLDSNRGKMTEINCKSMKFLKIENNMYSVLDERCVEFQIWILKIEYN